MEVSKIMRQTAHSMYWHLKEELSHGVRNLGLESVVAGIILAAVTIILALRINLTPATHSELTSGYLTWIAQSKTADYILPLLVPVVCTAVALCAGWTHSLVARTWGAEAAGRLSSLTLISSLPGIAGIAAWVTNAGGKDLIVFSAILITVLALAVWSTTLRRGVLAEHDVGELWAGALVGFVLTAFALLALGIGLSRLSSWNLPPIRNTSILLCGLAGLAVFLVSQIVGTAAPRRRFAVWLISAVQFPAPLGFLLLVPPLLILPDGTVLKQAANNGLWTVLAISMAAAWWSIASRGFRRQGDKGLLAAVSPWTLVALIVVVKCGPWPLPAISPDDYHAGERLVPAWMTITFGAWPYIDVTPAHGLSDYVGQIVNFVFFDGTAANINAANRIGVLAYLMVLFWVLRPLAGTWMSFGLCAVLTPIALPLLSSIFFAAIIFFAQRAGVRSYWLPLWVVVGTLALLLMPGQGGVLTAASIPLGSYLAFCAFKNDWRRAIPGVALLGILVFALLFTPMPGMILGAVRYVLQNGPINTIAYGLPWELSRSAVPYGPNGGALYEIFRSSWIAAPLVLGIAVIVAYTGNHSRKARFDVLATASVGVLFLLLLIPYSMGRIDPGGPSRLGQLIMVAWGVITPLAVYPLCSMLSKVRVVAVAAFMCSSMYVWDVQSVFAVAQRSLPVPPLTDGAAIGLPQLGRAVMEPTHLDRLRRLSAVLDALLPAREPYLDLSGRSAQYFYMERPQPIEIGAPYNIAPLAQQRRAVARLSAKPPAVALLEAQNINNEGRSVAIRSHELYRFVVQNYVPVAINGFVMGVHKDRSDLLAAVRESLLPASLTDVNWERGISRVRPGFFVSQPHLVRGLDPGDTVTFAGSGARRVERVEGVNVWVDGPALDPVRDGFPNQIHFAVREQRRAEWRLALFDQAFRVAQLDFLPNSWGSSLRALLDKIEPVAPPPGDPVHFNNMRRDADGGFTVLGPDPYVVFDISGLHLSGSQVGLLNLHFACMGQQGQPVIEVYFAAAGEVPTEDTVVRATVQDGDLLIPLDSQPRWLLANQLSLLRLDLADHRTCSRVRFDGVQLWNRKAF